MGASVDAPRMLVTRGGVRSGENLDGRLHVWMYHDSSEIEPRSEGESAAVISDRDEASRLLGERKGS